MISENERQHFYDVAHRRIGHTDSNLTVHGQMLYDHLRRYDALKQPSARARLEEQIRFRARQIERNRTPHEKVLE